jgi:hypothetical protein
MDVESNILVEDRCHDSESIELTKARKFLKGHWRLYDYKLHDKL